MFDKPTAVLSHVTSKRARGIDVMDKDRIAVAGREGEEEEKVILQASGYAEARNEPFHEVSNHPRTIYMRARTYTCNVVNVNSESARCFVVYFGL